MSNNDQWVTLIPQANDSLSLSGLRTKVASTIPKIIAKLPNDDGELSKTVLNQPLRLRSTKPSKKLLKFRSKGYRSAYVAAQIANRVATQIRLMREEAGITQTELATSIGTKQPAIARAENPEYGRHSITLLQKIADHFDVALAVEFTPFSSLLRRTADLSKRALLPKSYDREFDALGEPRCDLSLRFDNSVICITNYYQAIENFSPSPWKFEQMEEVSPGWDLLYIGQSNGQDDSNQ